MNKAGDSCELAKKITAVSMIVLSLLCSGVIFITSNSTKVTFNVREELSLASYEELALDMPVKMVDGSGNIIASSNGFSEKDIEDYLKKDEQLDETSKNVINNVFNGTFLKNYLMSSNIDNEKKEIINSLFVNKDISTESSETILHIEDIGEEENIIIPNDNLSGEELISVDQVNTNDNPEDVVQPLAPGQESVWLYEESQVPDNYIKYYDMTATAYCLCKKCTGKSPGSSGYGRTASGLVIKPGTSMKVCAVNRNQIPLGTHIYVQGLNGAKDYGYAIAADTGGAITTNRIDLYFDNHSTCLQWGRRGVRVYILPEE